MKEWPILFSAPMVRAILDGHKTQTRRVIDKDVSNRFDIDTDGTAFAYIDQATGDSYKPHDICIYKPGDILWVRETWCDIYDIRGMNLPPRPIKECDTFYYKADYNFDAPVLKWRPSIHMPKRAARIWLEVKDVRVERVQDIRPEDCESEGIDDWCDDGIHDPSDALRKQFHNLWDAINTKRGYGWDANPWVWAIEFTMKEVAK
ncbi:MAG TPA: hypothetical protein DD734_03870 [Firmicutes bacterium]|nr:hypothetical protein [Bacillota bacterium]